MQNLIIYAIFVFLLAGCDYNKTADFDVIIRNGMVYDGSGSPGRKVDIAFSGDKIVSVGKLQDKIAKTNIDASGQVVSPGFINMLSWSVSSLIQDGRGLSDIRQGVTLEVFGEGYSPGPLSEKIKRQLQESIDKQANPYKIEWTTLGEYLQYLEDKGVSPNVASFIGATTVRVNVIGYEDRSPTDKELQMMRNQVRQAMKEGAMGLGSSLIYAPAFYSTTEELVALAQVVGEYNGMYISHMRSEGNQLLESLEELITIAREGNVAAEIYHLKASGRSNWHKMDAVYKRVEQARATGLNITANMYTYRASSTGLNATMPPWVQEGGYKEWVRRLKDPEIRAKVIKEMQGNPSDWTNNLYAAGANGILLGYFLNPDLRQYSGKTLAEVAELRGTSAADTAIDLVIEDGSRVQCIFFTMTEDNIKKKIQYPWLSFGSDASAQDPEVSSKFGTTHPRAYGNFVRVIGKYVRDEKILSMEEAIRKLTSLPASNLKIPLRGKIQSGYFADVVVFDPDTVTDHATFTDPHQLATGVNHVFVNGVQVLKNGAHTGATPGKFVKGPGYTGTE